MIRLLLCLCWLPLAAADLRIVTHPREAENTASGPRFVVDDPDAHGGNAQAAIVGKSKVGAPIASFYGYARPGAIYRIVFRVKVADNTHDAVVLTASASNATDRRYPGGSMELKGTDFAAANVYQEFSFTAEKPEGGFFGIGGYWGGHTNVYIDAITIASERFFTDAEMAEREGGIELPDGWNLPPPSPLHVHLAKGLWWEYVRVTEALAWRGGGDLASSYHSQGQYGTALRGFPGTANDLMRHNLVLLANVDAFSLGPKRRQLLAEYVRQGGAVMIFGGFFALSRGNYAHTSLEALLPCTFEPGDRQRSMDGLVIAPTELGRERLPALAWAQEPRLWYYHRVSPRPEAEVWLTAGDQPLLITHRVGKGRVAFWAGTVEGLAADGQIAAWEWGDMPRCLDAVFAWLIAEQTAEPPATDAAAEAAFDRLATIAIEPEAEAEAPRLIAGLAARCHSTDFAQRLIEAIVTTDVPLSVPTVDAIAEAVRPHVTPALREPARKLIGANVGKSALGQRLLGFTGNPDDAADLLAVVSRMGDVATAGAVREPGAAERRMLAAVQALGDLGAPTALEPLRHVTDWYAKHRPDAMDTSIEGDLRDAIYQHLLLARLRLGDNAAAKPLVDSTLDLILQIELYQNYLDVMLQNKDDMALIQGQKRARIRLPVLRPRHATLLATFRQLPPAAWPALAAELAARDDRVLLPFAYAAFARAAQAPVPAELLPGLVPLVSQATLPELRLLGCRLLSAPDGQAHLDQALLGLAKSERPADPLFALQRLSQVSATVRPALLEAAAACPDPTVQRYLARTAIRNF